MTSTGQSIAVSKSASIFSFITIQKSTPIPNMVWKSS
jgi:hypothetical protein